MAYRSYYNVHGGSTRATSTIPQSVPFRHDSDKMGNFFCHLLYNILLCYHSRHSALVGSSTAFVGLQVPLYCRVLCPELVCHKLYKLHEACMPCILYIVCRMDDYLESTSSLTLSLNLARLVLTSIPVAGHQSVLRHVLIYGWQISTCGNTSKKEMKEYF